MKTAFTILLPFLLAVSTALAGPPHIVLIYADDMGLGDVSVTGGELLYTPNIEKMAADGKVFTQYYSASPASSPARVAAMTGMYPLRWDIDTELGPEHFNREAGQADFLDPGAPSLARILQAGGYRTAQFGAWPLGSADGAPPIGDYGFDEVVTTGDSTPDLVGKTIEFLRQDPSRPAFVNLWPGGQDADSVASRQRAVDDLDRQVGRLMRALRAYQLDRNTLLILAGDNGPAPAFDGLRTNGLRGAKYSLYEGGLRVPFIAWWPGAIEASQVESAGVLAAIDLLPSIVAIAGLDLPAAAFDGENASAAFTTTVPWQREKPLYWSYGLSDRVHFPADGHRSPQLAVRDGNWKLLVNADGSGAELYDLASDPAESQNLAGAQPDLVRELTAAVTAWYRDNDRERVR